ncbi:hypothetical protein B0H15DRAFT_954088 [Mycena belliarum]|uniref:Uncharacterized protein n=1 Tax=Mycena belliarum TaxID=1033014 RepID=A0AAD6TVU8_9AGAR|nr:hypothetical protein B0H15DRAFT_954088 [Mycena belliae]
MEPTARASREAEGFWRSKPARLSSCAGAPLSGLLRIAGVYSSKIRLSSGVYYDPPIPSHRQIWRPPSFLPTGPLLFKPANAALQKRRGAGGSKALPLAATATITSKYHPGLLLAIPVAFLPLRLRLEGSGAAFRTPLTVTWQSSVTTTTSCSHGNEHKTRSEHLQWPLGLAIGSAARFLPQYSCFDTLHPHTRPEIGRRGNMALGLRVYACRVACAHDPRDGRAFHTPRVGALPIGPLEQGCIGQRRAASARKGCCSSSESSPTPAHSGTGGVGSATRRNRRERLYGHCEQLYADGHRLRVSGTRSGRPSGYLVVLSYHLRRPQVVTWHSQDQQQNYELLAPLQDGGHRFAEAPRSERSDSSPLQVSQALVELLRARGCGLGLCPRLALLPLASTCRPQVPTATSACSTAIPHAAVPFDHLRQDLVLREVPSTAAAKLSTGQCPRKRARRRGPKDEKKKDTGALGFWDLCNALQRLASAFTAAASPRSADGPTHVHAGGPLPTESRIPFMPTRAAATSPPLVKFLKFEIAGLPSSALASAPRGFSAKLPGLHPPSCAPSDSSQALLVAATRCSMRMWPLLDPDGATLEAATLAFVLIFGGPTQALHTWLGQRAWGPGDEHRDREASPLGIPVPTYAMGCSRIPSSAHGSTSKLCMLGG